MLEFRTPDEKLTSQAVRNFFKNVYPELSIKASISNAYPKSPILKNINVQESKVSNSEERRILEYLGAKNIIDGVQIALDTLKKVNDTLESIVRFTFINNLPITMVCQRVCITESTYYRNIDSALTLFAIAFAPWLDLRRWD